MTRRTTLSPRATASLLLVFAAASPRLEAAISERGAIATPQSAVPGVLVRLVGPDPDGDAAEAMREHARVRTAADGTFEALKPIQTDELPLAETWLLDIRGRVRDRHEEMLVGARIDLARETEAGTLRQSAFGQTDETGAFELRGLEPGRYLLTAIADGHQPAERWVLVSADSSRAAVVELELLAQGEIEIEALVIDANGERVAGVKVSNLPQSEEGKWDACTTLEDGTCALIVDPSHGVRLSARHPDYPDLQAGGALLIDPADPRAVLRLDPMPWPLVTVKGRLLDADGSPLRGVEISLSDPLRHAPMPYLTQSGIDGRFRLEGVKGGAYRVDVEIPGHAVHVSAYKAAPGASPLDIRLSRGTTLHGEIFGLPAAAPIRVSALWIESMDADPDVLTIGAQGFDRWVVDGRVTGSRFSIPHLPPGIWFVAAEVIGPRAGKRVRATAKVEIEAGRTEVLADLLPSPTSESTPWNLPRTEPAREVEAITIQGRLLDSRTGLGLGEGWLRHRGVRRVDQTGSFELQTIAEPPFEIEVEATGYVDRTVVVTRANASRLEIPLEPSAGLRYDLRWSDGTPLSWPSLELVGPTGKRFDATGENPGRFDGMPDGDYTLVIRHTVVELSLAVRVPDTAFELTLPPLGGVQVKVPDLELDFRRGWLDGVVVEATPIDAGPASPARAVGDLTLENLTPGLWQITVTAPDGRAWTAPAEVRDKRSTIVYLD